MPNGKEEDFTPLNMAACVERQTVALESIAASLEVIAKRETTDLTRALSLVGQRLQDYIEHQWHRMP